MVKQDDLTVVEYSPVNRAAISGYVGPHSVQATSMKTKPKSPKSGL